MGRAWALSGAYRSQVLERLPAFLLNRIAGAASVLARSGSAALAHGAGGKNMSVEMPSRGAGTRCSLRERRRRRPPVPAHDQAPGIAALRHAVRTSIPGTSGAQVPALIPPRHRASARRAGPVRGWVPRAEMSP